MNDIISRWRDAITDLPKNARTVILRQADGHEITAYNVADGQWHYDDGMIYAADPGDQWLDITDVPAVPLAKVQAAVDEINKRREPWRKNIVYTYTDQVLDGVLDAIRNRTGVTPSDHFRDATEKVTHDR